MKALLNGPQGRTVLGSAILTIGSSPDNLLVIDNVKISAHHAEIRPEEQGYSITDLGSIHGTYVNGGRLDFNTPQRLGRGNSIAIGDTTFTYEEEEEPQVEPVPSASPDQERGYGTSPSDEETLSSQDVPGVGVEGMAPGNQQLIAPQAAYTLPEKYMTQPTYPGMVGTTPAYVGPIPGYVPIEQVRRGTRRLIAIGLGLLIVIGLGVFGFIYFTRSTPEKTLDTYCNSLLGQDYLTAYNQLSTVLQTSETESQFANILEAQGKVTTCKHGSASINGFNALVNLTFDSNSGQNFNSPVTLIQDSGNTWKISVPFPPEVTLTTYCHALKSKDYQIAYDQLATNVKSQFSETDFETGIQQSNTQNGGIVNCTVSNVTASGSSATGTITFVARNGQSGNTLYSLAIENGIWKISGAQ